MPDNLFTFFALLNFYSVVIYHINSVFFILNPFHSIKPMSLFLRSFGIFSQYKNFKNNQKLLLKIFFKLLSL